MRRTLSPSLLAWLRAFEAAARHGSFTRAAAELCVTQGAISQQVGRLEASLGVSLFSRGPRSLALTEAGERLAPKLIEVFAGLRDALDAIGAANEPGALTLSCSPSFALRWLGPRLTALPPALSGMDLRVFGEFHRLDRERMARDGLEAAVRYDALEYHDLSVTIFLDEFLVAVARPGFAREHDIASPDDLDGALLLHDVRPWDGVEEGEEWLRYERAAGVRIDNCPLGKRFNLSQMAVDAALTGDGIAIGRLALVLDDLEAGRLEVLFGLAVPALASYKLVALPVRSPRTSAVEIWLNGEATKFLRRRDAFLSRCFIAGNAST